MHLHLHLPEEWVQGQADIIHRLDVIVGRLDRIQAAITVQQHQLQQTGTQIMADLTALTAQVTANTTVEQSALDLINGIAQRLADAAGNPAALQTLTDQLNTSATALAAAVAANTPATGGGGGTTPTGSLYAFTGTDPTTIDPAYTVASVKEPDGTVLYTFSGDAAGQPAAGGSADFTEYTGPTV